MDKCEHFVLNMQSCFGENLADLRDTVGYKREDEIAEVKSCE